MKSNDFIAKKVCGRLRASKCVANISGCYGGIAAEIGC